eukprot:3689435-Pyramimonas_sp.AAC.3
MSLKPFPLFPVFFASATTDRNLGATRRGWGALLSAQRVTTLAPRVVRALTASLVTALAAHVDAIVK